MLLAECGSGDSRDQNETFCNYFSDDNGRGEQQQLQRSENDTENDSPLLVHERLNSEDKKKATPLMNEDRIPSRIAAPRAIKSKTKNLITSTD